MSYIFKHKESDMKVVFVGMHNKPGKLPLDSSTMTGKVIDSIIKNISCECIKTNLCEVDYFPDNAELIKNGNSKYNEYDTKSTVFVLLGTWVYEHFEVRANKVKVTHPAGVFGPSNKLKYIEDTARRINLLVDVVSLIHH